MRRECLDKNRENNGLTEYRKDSIFNKGYDTQLVDELFSENEFKSTRHHFYFYMRDTNMF